MIVFPNAKINIGLFVTNKRPDGFHNLETIFYPISLCDALEVVVSESLQFSCSGIQLDSKDEDNIVLKTYQLLKNDFNLPPVSIHLHKKIPFGAGLGGGSADASFLISILNEQFNLNLSLQQKLEYARQIGSDCAFFLYNQPCYANEKGDQLKPIELNQLNQYQLLLLKPDFSVSTPLAYRNIQPKPPLFNLIEADNLDINDWPQLIKNDFETNVFKQFPRLKEIKTQLYDLGAAYASMSGSGSSMFAFFKEIPSSAHTLFPDCFTWKQ